MKKPLHVLFIEDSEDDVQLLLVELRRGGFEPVYERVETAGTMQAALGGRPWDIVLSDNSMPLFDAPGALKILRQSGHDIPFIVVSGSIGEEVAVMMMKDGAHDYLLKQNLTRLVPAVQRELAEAQNRRERGQAEEELRKEHDLFQGLASAIPDRIYFKDRRSRFVRINKSLAHFHGLLDPGEVLGKTDFNYFSEEHARQAFEEEQSVMSTGEPLIDIEEKETWPDGHVTWASSTKMPLRDASGIITGLVGISRDITERREANERIHEQAALLDIATDGIMVIDLQHRIHYWSKGAERLYGWSAAEAIGREQGELLCAHPGICESIGAAVLKSGDWMGEMPQKTKAQKEIVTLSRWTLVRDEQGPPRSILIINSDITEKHELEARFLRAQRLESIGMLASGIAHDLNNVLAPIGMVTTLLRCHLSERRDLEMLDILEKSAERGAGLIRQILGFAHGIGGERSFMQPKHLLHDIEVIVAETFPKSIVLEANIPSDLWPIIGNPTQIHQVLLNLCVNARDAMPQGGKLSLLAENCVLDQVAAAGIEGAKPGMWVVLHVVDTGMGIPPEVLPHIWEPFFTTKTADKGTGLGLSTVRGIVVSHKGFITLETKPGRGTTIRVYLPSAESPVTGGGDAQLATAGEGHGEFILVVDDEAPIRETISRILTRSNYQVMTAANGIDALSCFMPHIAETALIITDLDMPVLDGAALARAIHRFDPAKKILAMSGLGDSSAENESVRLFSAFMRKPFTAEALLSNVEQLLHDKSIRS